MLICRRAYENLQRRGCRNTNQPHRRSTHPFIHNLVRVSESMRWVLSMSNRRTTAHKSKCWFTHKKFAQSEKNFVLRDENKLRSVSFLFARSISDLRNLVSNNSKTWSLLRMYQFNFYVGFVLKLCQLLLFLIFVEIYQIYFLESIFLKK